MPHWESELEALLNSLGVSYNGPGDVHATEFAEEHTMSYLITNETDAENEQIGIVRREIEATMSEVTRLMSEGYLDPTLRNDITIVLHALMRPTSTGSFEPDEWQLESSAAVLHFCRIVMRLTRNLD
jgi:hypothetical protein